MIKKIILIIITFLLTITCYQPSYDVFDLVVLQRHIINYDNVHVVEFIRYDMNNDFKIDNRDIEIMKTFILNEGD